MPPVTYLAVDNNNNIFACLRNRDSYYNNNKVILVNEEEDASRLLIPDTGAPLNQPCMLDDGENSIYTIRWRFGLLDHVFREYVEPYETSFKTCYRRTS